MTKRLELTERGAARSPVQVSVSDTQELIRLTEALDELASKIDRIGGVVVKLYQLTENLELALKKVDTSVPQQPQLDEAVVEWIRDKVEKKRKKQLKKWRKKQGKKRKD